MDQRSAASTSSDRSAVNLAPMMMTMTMMVPAILQPVDRTRATTTPRANHGTLEALLASVGPGSRAPAVSTPRHYRLRHHLRADQDSASTAAAVQRQPTGWPDVAAHRRGLDDTARSDVAQWLLL